MGHSKRNKQESKLCELWLSSLETNIAIIFYGLILIFSTSTLHWWRNIIYSLKEGDIKYIFQLLWKSGWEKEGIGMILLNGDLPLEIQPLKGTSQVVSRPVQDLSCKWPGFAYTLFHSASLHLFPTSPCYWNKHPNCRSEWLGLHLGNQWDWLYTKCCKVHEVNQPNKWSRAVAQLSSATFGVVGSNSRSTGRHVCPSNCSATPSPAPQLRCGVPAFTRW